MSGALAGLAVAFAHIPIGAWPKGFMPPSSVRPDGKMLSSISALALLTGAFFGIVPMVRMFGETTNRCCRKAAQ